MNQHSFEQSNVNDGAETGGAIQIGSIRFDPTALSPPIEQVARYFGGSRYTPGAEAIADIAESIGRALQLIAPVVSLTFHRVTGQEEAGKLCLQEGFCLEAPGRFHDRHVRSLAVAIGSLGKELEICCRSLAQQKQIYQSTLLDAVGTAMLDVLDVRLRCFLDDHARRLGLFAGMRFSPGLDGYPLERQKVLFELVGEATAEVRLNEACIMEPAKSISFFRLLTSEQSDGDSSGKCECCHMLHCQYRNTR